MKRPSYYFYMLLFCCVAYTASAQTDSVDHKKEFSSSTWNERGLTMGINYYKYAYGELGYFHSKVFEVGGLPLFSTLMNYGLEFSHIDELIVAPKIKARVHFFILNGSLTAICYTDMSGSYSFKLRPEVGLGLKNLDLNFGYNIPVTDHKLDPINDYNFSLRYYASFSKKNVREYTIRREK